MTDARKLWIDLNDQEIDALRTLQVEMGLASVDEVVHALIRQAYSRAAIVCPHCGHSAQLTAEDEARCDGCLSILQLSDQIWRVAVTR